MHFPSSDSKVFQPPRQPQPISTPTNFSQYSSVPKTYVVKDLSEGKVIDPKFSLNKKNSLETASSGSNNSNSTTSSISSMATVKIDFISKEKNYQNTIDKLQKRIEALTMENKKITESSNARSSCVINRNSEEWSVIEEKERNLQKKIDKLLEDNSNLAYEFNAKVNEIQALEKKLNFGSHDEVLSSQLKQIQTENQSLMTKLSEKEKKYEELEEAYKQKLSQFKREISTIKAQQKETSQKDVAESIAPLNLRIKELEDIVRKKTEEITDLTNKLHRKSNISINFETNDPRTPSGMLGSTARISSNKASEQTNRLGYEGQRDSRYNLSQQGLIKCNWEELEKKITSLVDENDKLTENVANENNENVNWRRKYLELEEKYEKMMLGGFKEDGVREILEKTRRENEELKRTTMNLSSENSNISGRLADIERKMEGFGRESQEELRRKEEEMRVSFEQTLSRLEEQKEKNLMKISKENHELKQHNDELKQQIESLQKRQMSNNNSNSNINESTMKKTNEKQPLAQNSSPILIINEMMTPSAKNLLEKNGKEGNNGNNINNKNNGLSTVVEVKDENVVFNFTKNKKNSNENIKKTYFSNNNNSNPNTNVINLQPQGETLKPLNKTHNSRDSQEFPNNNKYITKNYGVGNINSAKENNNSKEISFKENNLKESNISFKDVNESGKVIEVKNNENTGNSTSKNNEKFDFLNHKSDYKQGNYLQNVRGEYSKKETKVISFNLLDNKLKNDTPVANVSARFTKV